MKIMSQKIIMPALLALASPIATFAAPAKPAPAKNVSTKVSVDAKARDVFGRAAKLYGVLKGLKLGWTVVTHDIEAKEKSSSKVALDFDRAGRLRLTDPVQNDSLMVVDGKDEWFLDDSRMESDEITYRHQVVESEDYGAKAIEWIGFNSYLTEPIETWLSGLNPFDARELQDQFGDGDWTKMTAQVIAPAEFNRQRHDRVRVTTTGGNADTEQIYWFGRPDGRLMRMQMSASQNNIKYIYRDWQVTEQTFNPQFAPDTFKFTPPKGAVLQTD